jgi:hypothetical protein
MAAKRAPWRDGAPGSLFTITRGGSHARGAPRCEEAVARPRPPPPAALKGACSFPRRVRFLAARHPTIASRLSTSHPCRLPVAPPSSRVAKGRIHPRMPRPRYRTALRVSVPREPAAAVAAIHSSFRHAAIGAQGDARGAPRQHRPLHATRGPGRPESRGHPRRLRGHRPGHRSPPEERGRVFDRSTVARPRKPRASRAAASGSPS